MNLLLSTLLMVISNLAPFLKRKGFRKGAFLLNNIAKVLSAGLVVLLTTQTGAFSFTKSKSKKLKGAHNMTQVIIGNAAHPEYGVATIPFPIPRTEYANCVALLEALEIGDASDRDCQVQEVCGPWPALKRLEGKLVNLEELD